MRAPFIGAVGVAVVFVVTACHAQPPRTAAPRAAPASGAPAEASAALPAGRTVACTAAAPDSEDLVRISVWMHDVQAAWPKLRAERRAEGIDSSSGFEYVRLSDASGVRLLRVILDPGPARLPVVTDYFYRDGRAVAVLERLVAPGDVSSVRRGERGERETLRWLALFDDSGNMTTLLNEETGRPMVLSCEEWREREESYRSFTSMDW